MYQLYRDSPMLVICMVLANIALSLWCINIDPVINNDGITYLAISQMMLDGNWSQAFEYYSWPYYSVFIAITAKVLFLDIETAAYVINTLFVTSLTLAFVCVVGELSNNNRRIIVIAIIVILFFPSITKYRSFIIRDFGYLSCYLWSLYFIFRFCNTLNKSHLIGWLLFAALSCLFRFALASISLIVWYVNDKYASLIEVARESGKDIHNIVDLFLDNIETRLGSQKHTAANYAGVITTNILDVIYELVRRMAIFYFLFACYAYYKNIGIESRLTKRIWLVYVLINFLVLVGFSLYNNFLVSRYTMATALTLLILAPFVIDRLLRAFSDSSSLKRTASIVAIGLLSLASLEGLDVRTKKNHIKKAGLWIANELPGDAKVYSNDRLIAYYAKPDVKANLQEAYSNPQLWMYMDIFINLTVINLVKGTILICLPPDENCYRPLRLPASV